MGLKAQLWVLSIGCYMLAYMMLAFVYMLSLFIPPLASIVKEYETKGTRRSIWVIAAISSTAISLSQIILFIILSPMEERPSFLTIILCCCFNLGWAYCCLFFYDDYRRKREQAANDKTDR